MTANLKAHKHLTKVYIVLKQKTYLFFLAPKAQMTINTSDFFLFTFLWGTRVEEQMGRRDGTGICTRYMPNCFTISFFHIVTSFVQ